METDRTNARVDRPRPHARGHLGGRGFGRRRQNPPSSRQSEDINDGADGPVSLERLPTVNGHDGLATALSFYRRLLIQTEIEAAEDVRLPGDTTFDDVTGIVVGSDDIDSHASDEGVAVAAELLDETIQRRSPNLERHHRVVGGGRPSATPRRGSRTRARSRPSRRSMSVRRTLRSSTDWWPPVRRVRSGVLSTGHRTGIRTGSRHGSGIWTSRRSKSERGPTSISDGSCLSSPGARAGRSFARSAS